jgi:hypothetical protein
MSQVTFTLEAEMHSMKREINPAHTKRIRAYQWDRATEVARKRGDFTRPSQVIDELIDLGIESLERKQRNTKP